MSTVVAAPPSTATVMRPWSTSRTARSATWMPMNRNVAVAPATWLQFAVPAYMSATPVVTPQLAP
ncbi:hypothetical protein ACFPIJ_00150 [Dactylosporangium cerinum]|uniref:Uncharacterized protein n=1 Tax=Dactylosporangium cerinum TaxID=1434730 RepID=A0ABV9VLN2_9ACTN